MADLQPLNWQIAIVNLANGAPTLEFQRAWAALQAATGSIPATPQAISDALDLLGATPGSLLRRTPAGWEIITGAEGDLLKRGSVNWELLASPNDPTRFLAGDLTWQTVGGSDIQDMLDTIGSTWGDVLYRGTAGWAALPAGTAGDFLQTQGAGADPTWATAGGGGGGGDILDPMLGIGQPTPDTGPFPTKGFTFYCGRNCTLKKVYVPISNTSAGVPIECRVFETDANVSACTSAALGVASDTSAADKMMVFTFPSPISLVAGKYYAICIVATAAFDDFTSIPLIGCSTRIATAFSDLFGTLLCPEPAKLGNYACVRINSRNPISGTAINASLNNYVIHCEGSVP